jgi:hypothetical protein
MVDLIHSICAGVFNLSKAPKEGGETEMPAMKERSFDETMDAGKLTTAAMRRNAITMSHLVMTFTTDDTMALVYEAMDNEWPSGLAQNVAKELKQKYQPQDTMTCVELRQMLNKVSMKTVWF